MDLTRKIAKEFKSYIYQPRAEQARVDRDLQDRMDYLGYMDVVYRLTDNLMGD